jgi:hypothetical protein
VERAMGIEPTALAWEARVLPLYDARINSNSTWDTCNIQIDSAVVAGKPR